MMITKEENAGIELAIEDYAEKLGITGIGIQNIRELFETGRF